MSARDERSRAILDAATALFAQSDLHTVQMDQIARAAGVAKGTLYNHFGSKERLYYEALRYRLERLIEVLQAAYEGRNEPWRNLRSFLIHWQAFMVRHPYFFKLWRQANGLVSNKDLLALHGRVEEILCEVLDQGMRDGAFHKMPIKDVSKMILGMLDHRVASMLARGRIDKGPGPILDLLRFGLGGGRPT